MEINTIATTPGYLATGCIRVLARNVVRIEQRGCVFAGATSDVHMVSLAPKPDFRDRASVCLLERSP